MHEVPLEVSFRFDAPELSPRELAEDLYRVTRKWEPEVDNYLEGGSIAAFEETFARLLGKERAVFMPTGTLANHLAVRTLGRGRSRVLVQERGHIYNDTGDGLQRLSGFNVIPLAQDRTSFTLEEVQEALRVAEQTRVRVEIGALVIETPVRRMHGERFDHDEMLRICAFARQQGIGLHLDGARLFIASAYSGITVPEYTASFDTVYISLYKYFGAPSGAVLAGPAAVLDDIHRDRRMFGGALNQGWMFAAAALDHLEGFTSRFAHVVSTSETLKNRLRTTTDLTLTDIPNGTNVCRLELPSGVDPTGFRKRLREHGIQLPAPDQSGFYLKMNESLLVLPVDALVERFSLAL